MMENKDINLFQRFKFQAIKDPNHLALFVNNSTYSYWDLYEESLKIACALSKYEDQNIGILGNRSLSVYAGILGILASDKTYVPLNIEFPLDRNALICQLGKLKIIIVDNDGLNYINSNRAILSNLTVIISPNVDRSDINGFDSVHIVSKNEIVLSNNFNSESYLNDIAYIMFTSGTTGIPKGVMIKHTNVTSYIDFLSQRYQISNTDRFSQTFDVTFDLSVHDIFLSLTNGASLFVPTKSELLAPNRYINKNQLTMWFSVPALGQFMKRFKMLKKGNLPSLRYSLFCGEPLNKEVVMSWQDAALNSIIENIYGPTETTIGISAYCVPKDSHLIAEKNGIVSIGQIFSGQKYCLVDENLNIATEHGQLLLCGSQVSEGYWNNSEKTEEKFIRLPNNSSIWYKTGDIVEIRDGLLFYIERLDFQVKVRGYRIELEEINVAIKKIILIDDVVSIPYPIIDGIAMGIVSFIINDELIDEQYVITKLKEQLPTYMAPERIICVSDFPLNSNGKIDKKRLLDFIN